MIKQLIRLLKFIDTMGWLGFLTCFIPVYWKQDSDFKNNGYDIWSFKDKSHSYFKGTYKQKNKLWDAESYT